MPEYDGSIVIDSHIDTANFDADANKLFWKLRDVSSRINDSFRNINIQNIGTQIKNTFVSLNLSQLNSQIEMINQSITKIGNNKAPRKLKNSFKSASSGISSVLDDIGKRFNSTFKGLNTAFATITNRFRWILLGQAIRAVINDAKESIADLRTYSSSFDKTMQSLRDSAKMVGNSLATAFAPILQALAPIIANVARWITELLNKIAIFNSVLFTGSKTAVIADTSFSGYSKTADKAAKNTNKATKAIKEQTKALAKFDKLDVFKKDKAKTPAASSPDVGSVAPQAMRMFKTVEVPKNISDFANNLRETLKPLADEFKIIGDSFQKNFVAPVVKHVKENILPRFIESTKKSIEGMDFTRLNESLERFFKAMSVITKELFSGLEWGWENVLLPIIDKTITDYLPKFLDILASSLSILNFAWQAAKPYLKTLVTWLKELGDPLIRGFLDGVKDAMDGLKWVIENICPPIKRLGEALESIHIPQQVQDFIYMVSRLAGRSIFGIAGLLGSAFGTGARMGVNTSGTSLRIPGFASGTVVSPNRRFLAMLGDNTTEPEVVSPISTMKQAFKEAFTESGMSGNNGNVVLQLDGTTFARLINPYSKAEQTRIGVSMIEGVAY